MAENADVALVAHLNALLSRAASSGGYVAVELQDSPHEQARLQSVSLGSGAGVELVYTFHGFGPFGTEISATDVFGSRVRQTPNGAQGRDCDGETIVLKFVGGT